MKAMKTLSTYEKSAKSIYGAGKLLTKGESNTKTGKNKEVTYLMTLAPANMNDTKKSSCSHATPGCIAICLVFSGLADVYTSINKARINKTNYMFKSPIEFYRHLQLDIENKAKYHSKKGEKVVMRLNTMSDIDFLHNLKARTGFDYKTLTNVIFYDYTASIAKVRRYANDKQVVLTFSRKENNWEQCIEAHKLGVNISVVFDGKLPKTYNGIKVIDGDISDTEMLRYKGIILGLKAKGKRAKNDKTGFVVRNA